MSITNYSHYSAVSKNSSLILLGWLFYSIASSEMSDSVCCLVGCLVGLYVCLFVYMCRLPWLDHSRLRSENSFNNWRFTQDVYIRNCISYYTMRHNYTTFHESTTIDISILNFILEWLNNLRITFFYLFDESIYWCCNISLLFIWIYFTVRGR